MGLSADKKEKMVDMLRRKTKDSKLVLKNRFYKWSGNRRKGVMEQLNYLYSVNFFLI